MKLLDKQTILNVDDLPHEDVFVQAWNGTVRVRAMSGKERDNLRAIMEASANEISVVHANLLAVTLVDETGAQLFTAGDVDGLRNKCATALDNLFAVAMRLNRMGDKAVDDAVKNLEGDQNAGSGSVSP